MKSYNSFLIRCWVVTDERQTERAVFHVRHIQSAENTRSDNLSEVQRWMMQVCAAARMNRLIFEGPDKPKGALES